MNESSILIVKDTLARLRKSEIEIIYQDVKKGWSIYAFNKNKQRKVKYLITPYGRMSPEVADEFLDLAPKEIDKRNKYTPKFNEWDEFVTEYNCNNLVSKMTIEEMQKMYNILCNGGMIDKQIVCQFETNGEYLHPEAKAILLGVLYDRIDSSIKII